MNFLCFLYRMQTNRDKPLNWVFFLKMLPDALGYLIAQPNLIYLIAQPFSMKCIKNGPEVYYFRSTNNQFFYQELFIFNQN